MKADNATAEMLKSFGAIGVKMVIDLINTIIRGHKSRVEAEKYAYKYV